MTAQPVRFGVHVGPQQCTMPELRNVWRTAEDLGFDWVSVWDHFYPAPSPEDGDCFEAVACHAALAATTERVRVGSLVYSAGYRHPAVLANAAATIDHISNGRLEMGMGAGWHKGEYDAYGIPFEGPGTRLRRMAEAIQVIRLLWTQDVTTFDGEFFHLKDARCNPKPIQSPPRIWVGASGEKQGLALAGKHGDAWNVPFVSAAEFARKREIVLGNAPDPSSFVTGANVGYVQAAPGKEDEALAERFGPIASFVRPGILLGSGQSIVDQVGAYVDAGASWVILALRAPFDLDALAAFAQDVVPAFR